LGRNLEIAYIQSRDLAIQSAEDMNEKAAIGIVLVVIGLFGLVLFFPIYSPAIFGGWGCPMLGRRGFGGMMGPGMMGWWKYGGAPHANLGLIIMFDIAFVAILLLGVHLIWKSTQTTECR
jgi:hypothetical protein